MFFGMDGEEERIWKEVMKMKWKRIVLLIPIFIISFLMSAI